MLGVDNVGAVGASAIAITMLFQALKNSPLFPWLTRETEKANLLIGILAAGATTAGIHWAWDAHTGVATITISTHLLWSWFVQWAGQQGVYKGLVVPAETLGEIRGLLGRILTPPPASEGDAKTKG